MVERRRENDLRQLQFFLDDFFEDAEAVEAGHLHVEEDEVGRVLLDQVHGFEAVLPLSDERDFWKRLQQVGELLARGLFVVDDERVDGHDSRSSCTASLVYAIGGGDDNSCGLQTVLFDLPRSDYHLARS